MRLNLLLKQLGELNGALTTLSNASYGVVNNDCNRQQLQHVLQVPGPVYFPPSHPNIQIPGLLPTDKLAFIRVLMSCETAKGRTNLRPVRTCRSVKAFLRPYRIANDQSHLFFPIRPSAKMTTSNDRREANRSRRREWRSNKKK